MEPENKKITFFVPGQPPRATAQEKKVTVIHGRPKYYEPEKVKTAKAYLISGIAPYRPQKPLQGALSLKTCWMFQTKSARQNGLWKVTRPDTDNLVKMLKDCMTQCGFWEDDAQVCWETIEKRWSMEPGISIEIERLEDD